MDWIVFVVCLVIPAALCIWEDMESSGSKIICIKCGKTNAKEKHETTNRVTLMQGSLLWAAVIKRGILRLVWIEIQDLDIYKFPSDS